MSRLPVPSPLSLHLWPVAQCLICAPQDLMVPLPEIGAGSDAQGRQTTHGDLQDHLSICCGAAPAMVGSAAPHFGAASFSFSCFLRSRSISSSLSLWMRSKGHKRKHVIDFPANPCLEQRIETVLPSDQVNPSFSNTIQYVPNHVQIQTSHTSHANNEPEITQHLT